MRRQKTSSGFVGIVFLGIALIAIVIAAIASMSRNSSTGTATEAVKMAIATQMKTMADLKQGYERMLVNGVAASSIGWNSTPGTGLFDPSPGAKFALSPRIPKGFNGNLYATIRLPGVGLATQLDYLASTQVLALSTCQLVNNILYGDSLSAAPAVSTNDTLAWVQEGAEYGNDSNMTASNYLGREENCIQTSDGRYIYYKVMAAQ
jgi:hypothetical protein